MKNKKSLLSFGLLALILVLGVGYAIVTSQNLTISGSASTVDGGKIDVYFSSVAESATIVGDGVTASGEVSTTDELTASINVENLSSIGNSAELTYTISNRETDLAAEVLKQEITVLAADGKTSLADYYTVTTSVDDDPVTVPNNNGTTDGSATITVKVELTRLPIESEESTANITIKFVAEPVQPTASN